ncbi:MAG: polysaccharide deacetylase family protein [Kiritimatiellia bacterium]|nr:polysaccharide deacetylase family protein [Kiritimatiellia bacterium]
MRAGWARVRHGVLVGVMLLTAWASSAQTNAAVRVRVVQCWDDSLSTDIPLVALLRKHRAKATFNIIPRETARDAFVVRKKRDGQRVLFSFLNREEATAGGFRVEHLTNSEMPALYRGFRVAAHCGIPLGDTPVDSERRMQTLLKTKALIRDAFGQPVCGFVYPGGRFTPAAMADIRKAGYLYARTTRSAHAPLPRDEPMAQPASCHWAAADFWKRYEEAKRSGGVFYFWGHSCELGDDPELWVWLESLFERISADPEAAWADVIDLFGGWREERGVGTTSSSSSVSEANGPRPRRDEKETKKRSS